ncbi:MAG: PQQ-binding-like beta-propeller repeat protein [Acidobacteria bacterium]|nr:PQQ-binding-like beta-propeller repeat protein [Acidobacteriota bacterium]
MRSLSTLTLFLALSVTSAPAADWPNWRGLNDDGVSPDKSLPEKWSPDGENLKWKVPLGGRSTPVVVNGSVCVIRLSGGDDAKKWQEQVICVDEKTGKTKWEHRQNVFQTDIPHHRVGWASLVADASNGNIYSHSISGVVTAYSPQGKILWQRSLDEQIGRFSGFGGRTVTPLLDGDLLIVSFLTAGFTPNFIPRHRFYALNKTTGETVWMSTPGGAPYDTTYSAPIVRVINGERLLLAGNGDGGIYALQVQTGKKVWGYLLSKRGINTSVVEENGVVFASHSEDNLDESTAMGRLVALDGKQITDGKPKLLWMVDGFASGYGSPTIQDGILYAVDNSANVVAFDTKNGERLWSQNIGIAQKASPVLGDGKLYVSDVDGTFHIFKLNGRSAPEELDVDVFKNADGSATQINGSPAIANGVVYLITNNDLYAIARPDAKSVSANPKLGPPQKAPAGAQPAQVQVRPAEVVVYPKETQQFEAYVYDAKGQLIGPASGAAWAKEGGLQGEVSAAGLLTAAPVNRSQAGAVTATVGDLKGTAFVAVKQSIPYSQDFSDYEPKSVPLGWPGARGRFEVVDKEGEKMLFKASANQRSWRTTVYFGAADAHDYTMQMDFMPTEQKRRMPDAGLVSHRYTLDAMGNKQQLMIRSWMSELGRFSVEKKVTIDPDVWYTLKFRVEPSKENGPTKLFGKLWKRGEPEPAEWTIEAVDEIGHSQGSPGLYGYSSADIYYDNLQVTANQ